MLRTQRARLVTLALLVAALSAPAASAQAMPATSPGWRIFAMHHFGAARDLNGLSTVVAPGRNDAWALGGTGFYGGGVPVAEHWNGRSWRAAALPPGLNAGHGPVAGDPRRPRSLALIPGGSSMWGAGAVPTKTGANAAIWAYGHVG